jgi:hypothetical protein
MPIVCVWGGVTWYSLRLIPTGHEDAFGLALLAALFLLGVAVLMGIKQ